MGLQGEVDISDELDGIRFAIRTDNAGIMIGENGQNLIAFSHIIKRLAESKLGDLRDYPFSVDINDYQIKRIEEMKEIARMNAKRVRYFKKEVVMSPMNSYERRIIHSALTEYPDIKTESIGEGHDRRVVIKPFN